MEQCLCILELAAHFESRHCVITAGQLQLLITKFGDRSHIGAVLLATSLVADLQLLMAAFVWAMATHVQGGTDAEIMPSVVSLAGGALLANLASGVLLVIETAALRR